MQNSGIKCSVCMINRGGSEASRVIGFEENSFFF